MKKLLGILTGHVEPTPSQERGIFAAAQAAISLEAQAGYRFSGTAALVFRSREQGSFRRTEQEMSEILQALAESEGSRFSLREDRYHYAWLVVQDPEIEDALTLIHAAADTIQEAGFGFLLMCAVLVFQGEQNLYLIHNYKSGKFYPFVPTDPQGRPGTRNNAEELRLAALLKGELPWEDDLTNWYALWDPPLWN